jgi:CDP-paratose 2-epimerase
LAYLVTGGCGFVGSNLTAELIRRGLDVVVLDNFTRPGTPINLSWLRGLGNLEFFHADTRNAHDLEFIFRKFKIECVFHLAGQVAMTTSLADPRRDFETNVLGSFNILEAVRHLSPEATIVYASSNKVYGELENLVLDEKDTRYEPRDREEIDESAPLDFRTPYGCSKGAADQYMLEYARSFDINSVVFRHSTIYGGRQISTFDQGWVGWFCHQALDTVKNPGHDFTMNGNGKQVRDLLHVSDAVACYLAAHKYVTRARGQAFNIGGGYENSMSLLELFIHLEKQLRVKMNPRELPWRANDQKYFVADNSKANNYIQWEPKMTKENGIAEALEWEKSRQAGTR